MAQPHQPRGWKTSARQQAKQKKRRTVLTVVAAAILILTFVCKEVVVNELKEVSDSLQGAQSNVNTQRNVSDISVQIMTLSEESELDKISAVNASKDYSSIILRDSTLARQALANLNADFDSTSHLIDELLFVDVYGNWRKMRDQTRAAVDKTNNEVNEALVPSPSHDMGRMGIVKVAFMRPLVTEISVVILEGSALTAAQKLQDLIGMIRRFLTRLSYVFYVLGVGLGVYANLSGGKATLE
jgi:hypothetical protein